MSINITQLPAVPSRNDDPSTFATKANNFLAALPTFVNQLNAYAPEVYAAYVNGGFSVNNGQLNISDSSSTYGFSSVQGGSGYAGLFSKTNPISGGVNYTLRVQCTDTGAADTSVALVFTAVGTDSRSAQIRAVSKGTAAGNGHDLEFYTSSGGAIATKRGAFTEAGDFQVVNNLAIGEVVPLTKLHVTTGVQSGVIKDVAMFSQATGSTAVGQGVRLSLGSHSNLGRCAAIEAAHESATNAHYLAFLTNSNGAEPTERVRIDSAGNVGIGTGSNITSKLEVRGGEITFGDQALTATGGLGYSSANVYLRVAGANDLLLQTNGVTRATINGAGNTTFTGALLSSGGSANTGIGYATGAGGTVTQATSRTTTVSLSKNCGAITLFSTTTTAGQMTEFTFTNARIAANDVVVFSQKSGAGTYFVQTRTIGAGTCVVSVYTPVAVATAEAPAFNFTIIKGVTA